MLQFTQFLATLCTALFAGAATYINVVEHPARMQVDVPFARAQWLTGYQWGKIMQGSLAVLGCLSAIGAWWLSGTFMWLVGGLLIGFSVPFTFIVILPTHRKLQSADSSSADLRPLLQRWAGLHAVRSATSVLAEILMLWQLTMGAF
jgi:hypothetical protein